MDGPRDSTTGFSGEGRGGGEVVREGSGVQLEGNGPLPSRLGPMSSSNTDLPSCGLSGPFPFRFSLSRDLGIRYGRCTHAFNLYNNHRHLTEDGPGGGGRRRLKEGGERVPV